MMEEAGGTIGIAMFQMGFVPGLFRMASSAAYDVKGEIIPADHADSFFMAMRQPAGVVACFAPFNVPYILGSRSFTLPIAYGNTAVLKPSEEAPLTGGLLLAEIFEEAGLPTRVRRITTDEFGAKAPRPAYSVLRSERGAPTLPHWRDGLRECLARVR